MTRATLDVLRTAHTGEGVAELDGRTVLVAGALPGERVRVELRPGRVARARVLEVLTAHAGRIAPPCPHAERCGGCDLMHAAPELQRELRRQAVLDQLTRTLGAGALPEARIHAAGPELGYRSRARLAIVARGARVQVGYHAARSRQLAAVDRCSVLRPELQPAIGRLEELLAGSAGSGEAHVGLGEGERLVLEVRWSGELAAEAFGRAHRWVEAGAVAGVRLWQEGASVPASFGDARARMLGADGQPLWIAAGGFAQPSDEGARVLAVRVGALAALDPGGLTLELFAGSGTLTVAALPHAERYIAVELAPEAVDALRANLAARGLRATIIAADAESYEARRGMHTVLLDPPRSGAPKSCAALGRLRPRQIIYVSCHAAALARDLGALDKNGYRVAQLELIELFPQTSHIEVVARLVPHGDA